MVWEGGNPHTAGGPAYALCPGAGRLPPLQLLGSASHLRLHIVGGLRGGRRGERVRRLEETGEGHGELSRPQTRRFDWTHP